MVYQFNKWLRCCKKHFKIKASVTLWSFSEFFQWLVLNAYFEPKDANPERIQKIVATLWQTQSERDKFLLTS